MYHQDFEPETGLIGVGVADSSSLENEAMARNLQDESWFRPCLQQKPPAAILLTG